MARYKAKSKKKGQDKAGCFGALAILVIAIVAVVFIYLIVQVSGGLFGPTPKNVLVPDVEGKSLDEADKIFTARGLKLRKLDPVFSDEVPVGLVVVQDPSANRLVKEGRPIEIHLSKGPNAYLVPKLLGLTLEAAQARLKETQLSLGKVELILNPTLPDGQVVSQHPDAAEKLPASTAVDIVVSVRRTNKTIIMPDITAQPLSSAEGILVANNLVLSRVKYRPHPGIEFGQIVSQDPPAGKEVPLGTKVTVEAAADVDTIRTPIKNLVLRIKVPQGPETQEVKVVVEDRLGSNEVYKQRHKVGDVVDQQIKVEGNALIKIYFDGQLIRVDELPFAQ